MLSDGTAVRTTPAPVPGSLWGLLSAVPGRRKGKRLHWHEEVHSAWERGVSSETGPPAYIAQNARVKAR